MRQIRRVMLAIRVDEGHVGRARRQDPIEPRANGRTLASIGGPPQHVGPGALRLRRRSVRRAVVDDEDARNARENPAHDPRDGRLGLVRRHQRARGKPFGHGGILTRQFHE